MSDLLWGLVPWGIQAVAAIQNWAAQAGLEPAFTVVMRMVSDLGSVPAYALFILVAAQPWSRPAVPRPLLARLALLALISLYVNGLIKDWAAIPRPYLLAPAAIHPAVLYTDSAFPSGHAQLAATFWGALALRRRSAAAAVAATLWVAVIAFSRLALGVHYPQDVVAGAVLGLLFAVAGQKLGPAVVRRMSRWPRAAQLGVAVGLPLLATLAYHPLKASTVAGATAGLTLGYLLAVSSNRSESSQTPDGPVRALLRLALATVPAAGLYLTLGPGVAGMTPGWGQGALAFLLYFCTGLAVTGLPALIRSSMAAD